MKIVWMLGSEIDPDSRHDVHLESGILPRCLSVMSSKWGMYLQSREGVDVGYSVLHHTWSSRY